MQQKSTVEAFIEIPRGSRNKYEFDEKQRVLRLDRVLYSSVHYPTDYGFIPGTLALDGDHLDILVIVEEPNYPCVIVPARPIGVLDMEDEKGQDQKVLSVSAVDPRFDDVQNIEQISPHWLREIQNFFDTYKVLQELTTVVVGWEPAEKAWELIQQCRRRAMQDG